MTLLVPCIHHRLFLLHGQICSGQAPPLPTPISLLEWRPLLMPSAHDSMAALCISFLAKEKLYHWIIRQHEEGSRVTAADIASHIEKEIDYGGDDSSPRLHLQHQFPHATPHFPNPSILTPAFLGQPAHGAPPRPNHPEQAKNSVFSNALTSPVRRSLQPYQLAQSGGGPPCYQTSVPPSANASTRTNEVNSSIDRESNSPSPNDSSMEMH